MSVDHIDAQALHAVASVAREPWLLIAVSNLREYFRSVGAPDVPHNVRVSVGFPHKGGAGARAKTIGQCWFKGASGDGHHHVFIHPEITDPVMVLATLAHELVHAALPPKVGHRGRFVTAIRAIGLDGVPTATTPGEAFTAWADEALAKMPDWPHGGVTVKTTKQKTYLLKVGCIDCNHFARMTMSHVTRGLPHCPHCGLPWEIFPTWLA